MKKRGEERDDKMEEEKIKREKEELEEIREILKEIKDYIEKMSYCDIVDNPKKELSRILERENNIWEQ